jgi:hypothetical protein
MANQPIAYRSNVGPYNFLGVTTLLNCYAVKLGDDDKAPYAVVGDHGTVSFAEVTDTPSRGNIFMEDLDAVYDVRSSSVWKILEDGTETRVGTVPGIDRVEIVRNQKVTPQVGILCAVGFYVLENDTLVKLTDPDLPEDIVSVTEIGGYVVFGFENGDWYISSQHEMLEIDALDFANAEQSADKLVKLASIGGDLLVMGSKTIEPMVHTGNVDFPFELRSSSSVTRKGCLARHSVEYLDNTIFWIGDDRKVYRLSGFTAEKVSSEEVDRLIKSDPMQAEITATAYSIDGHDHYVITGSDWTMAYDVATGFWRRRQSYLSNRWQHDHALSAWDKILVSSRNDGFLYYLDRDTFTEAGATMIRGVDMPPLHAFPNGGIVSALHLDAATGLGLSDPDDLGYDPLLMVSWSDDGGNSFPIERQLKLGKAGNYRRVATRRMGRFGPKGRVYRIRQSDPVPFSLALADPAVIPLKR